MMKRKLQVQNVETKLVARFLPAVIGMITVTRQRLDSALPARRKRLASTLQNRGMVRPPHLHKHRCSPSLATTACRGSHPSLREAIHMAAHEWELDPSVSRAVDDRSPSLRFMPTATGSVRHVALLLASAADGSMVLRGGAGPI